MAEWRAGVPSLSVSASKFQGQKTSIEFGTAYASTEEPKPGQVHKYRFSTNEIKKPIQETVAAAVTFGGYPSQRVSKT